MLRALEISSSNQSGDMLLELRKVLISVNDRQAQWSGQSVWANNILQSITKVFLAQHEQLRAQEETILLMQPAIDAMARQQRLPGFAIPVNSNCHGYPDFLSPGVSSSLGFTGVPGPGFIQGPFSGSFASAPKHKQPKSKSSQSQHQMPVAIRLQLQPSHSYSAVGTLDLSSASSSSPSSNRFSEHESRKVQE
jgi:hypothetical protein